MLDFLHNVPGRPAVLAFSLAVLLCSSNVFAEEALKRTQAASNIVVQVRTIKASRPKIGESAGKRAEIDERLEDLRGKLNQINYVKFRLVSDDQMVVPFRRKQSLILKEGTVLIVRPLYYQEDRVGMWLKWIDKSGSHVLLDTRMHFAPGDSMLTGTDSPDDCGVILAIKAHPQP